jgi:hypothetical protein
MQAQGAPTQRSSGLVDTARHRMVPRDTAWQRTTPHGSARHRMAAHDIAWRSRVSLDPKHFIGHKYITTAPTKNKKVARRTRIKKFKNDQEYVGSAKNWQ